MHQVPQAAAFPPLIAEKPTPLLPRQPQPQPGNWRMSQHSRHRLALQSKGRTKGGTAPNGLQRLAGGQVAGISPSPLPKAWRCGGVASLPALVSAATHSRPKLERSRVGGACGCMPERIWSGSLEEPLELPPEEKPSEPEAPPQQEQRGAAVAYWPLASQVHRIQDSIADHKRTVHKIGVPWKRVLWRFLMELIAVPSQWLLLKS